MRESKGPGYGFEAMDEAASQLLQLAISDGGGAGNVGTVLGGKLEMTL